MKTSFDPRHFFACAIGALSLLLPPGSIRASENVPHAPFAQWAKTLSRGEFEAGIFYEESESYHIWAGSTYHNITVQANGESFGIDINQGSITLQYGITSRWTADLAMGYTTSGWRFFSNSAPSGTIQSTLGLMDTAFGVRYQLWQEGQAGVPSWTPTLAFRGGAVLPGSFAQHFPFAPGTRSAAIEPELLLRKHFGWPGLGFYGDGLFRWNRTTHNDQYIVSAGLVQEIKQWELSAGYRHLGTVTGSDIVLNPDRTIIYPRDVRENNDAIEAGFSYATSKWPLQIGLYTRTVYGGGNTDAKFWVGAFLTYQFGH